MLFYQKKHTKHGKTSLGNSGTTLLCQKDQLYALERIQEGSMASYIMLPSCSMFTKSVTVSVAVLKMGVVLIKHGSTNA